jgi:hypothetical protein
MPRRLIDLAAMPLLDIACYARRLCEKGKHRSLRSRESPCMSLVAWVQRALNVTMIKRRKRSTPSATLDDSRLRQSARRYRFIVKYKGVVSVATQTEAVDRAKSGLVIALVEGTRHPKWVVLRCPCGCGQVRRVSTSSGVEPSRRLKVDSENRVSLSPSVVLRTECRAHFVLRQSCAYVF